MNQVPRCSVPGIQLRILAFSLFLYHKLPGSLVPFLYCSACSLLIKPNFLIVALILSAHLGLTLPLQLCLPPHPISVSLATPSTWHSSGRPHTLVFPRLCGRPSTLIVLFPDPLPVEILLLRKALLSSNGSSSVKLSQLRLWEWSRTDCSQSPTLVFLPALPAWDLLLHAKAIILCSKELALSKMSSWKAIGWDIWSKVWISW